MAVSLSHVDGREVSISTANNFFAHLSFQNWGGIYMYKASDESRYLSISCPSWKIILQQNLILKPESLVLYCNGCCDHQLLTLPVSELMLSQPMQTTQCKTIRYSLIVIHKFGTSLLWVLLSWLSFVRLFLQMSGGMAQLKCHDWSLNTFITNNTQSYQYYETPAFC